MILEETYKEKVALKHRKKFAQFFTPEEVAKVMCQWLLNNPNLSKVLEPAFGLGVFSRELLAQKPNLKIKGFEVDKVIFDTAQDYFSENENVALFLEDYLFNDWHNQYDGIICNPPYFKFHDYENKETLEEIKRKLHVNLSGFTNIYTLFLLKSIEQLSENGRLTYIVPSEFLNSDYGTLVKEYLLKTNTLRHIFIFDFEENVFDDALTTSAILLLAKDKHSKHLYFSTIQKLDDLALINDFIENYPKSSGHFAIETKNIEPKIKWRTYYQKQASERYKDLVSFSSVAKVVRGIATGANDYFSFSTEKAKEHDISEDYLLPCITRSKDVEKVFFTDDDFEKLKAENAKVFLLDAEKEVQSKSVEKYLALGEAQKIHQKFLTSKRNPWYKLEKRNSPPIWVGVFNRKGLKFVRNETNVVNLTTFHCIYLKENLFNQMDIDLLFAYLLTGVAKEIFDDNRREYGDGLKKFEPNDLNKAKMLNLSKLGEESAKQILDLYQKYKISVLNNLENGKYIERIDTIFRKCYLKSKEKYTHIFQTATNIIDFALLSTIKENLENFDYTKWQANFFTKNKSIKSFSQKAIMYRKNLENS